MPLMDPIRYVGGNALEESDKDLQPRIMEDRELKK